MARRWLLLLLVALAAAACLVQAAGRKKPLTDREVDQMLSELSREEMDEKLNAGRRALRKQKQPAFDPTKIDMKNFDPMQFMAESKRGKPLMIIVELKEKRADKRAAEELLGIWGDALRQAYVPNTGYILDTDKFLFNLDDGAYAADAKKFLLAQKETKMVQIESQQYFPGDPMPKPADTGSSKKKKKRAAPPPPPPPPPPTEAPAADAHADEL